MIIDFQAAQTNAKQKKKIRYIITIGEQETPLYASRELQEGIITVMITARTPEEADYLRKEGTATVNQRRWG